MYWLKDKSAPFATFLNIVQAYYHPEVRNDNFDDLSLRAKNDPADDPRMAIFKEEFARLLEGDREGLPPDALGIAAEYEEHTDEEFLVWLWGTLYADEPVPGHHDSEPTN
jgi:hypothetical protein